MSTINPRLCFPNEEVLQARRQRRTAGERMEVPGGVVTAERRPSAWPVFTADEDRIMRRQLLEQDTAGDWLGIAAAEAKMPPSSPLPRRPYHTTPGAEETAEHSPRLDIGGFAPLVPADDWRALAAPAWQGPPPRKAVETGWYPYVVPWSAYLFLGARRRLPDEIEEVLPSSAAPVSLRPQDTGPLAAATATAPREKRGPPPVSRRRPPPPPPPPLSVVQVPAMRPPPTPVFVIRDTPSPVYVVRDAPPPPPPPPGRMIAGRPVPGPPPREWYEARAPSYYRPVGHHGVPASPPLMAPPGYGPPPPTWYAETSGEWRDPRMPTSSARGWTGPPGFGGERRGRAYYWK